MTSVDHSAGPAVRWSIRLPDGSFEGVGSLDSLQVAGPRAAANADVPRGSPVVVLNLRSGAEAYRVERRSAPYPARPDAGRSTPMGLS